MKGFLMAYRYGDRCQKTLFPQSIDEYIPNNAPVRVYDVIIGSLDFDELGIEVDPHKVGCPQYDPKVMLKLLVYGYSYRVRSSRKLEREANYNLSFIWLTGGLELLRIVKERYPNIVRMVLSGYTQVTTLLTAINQGEIYKYITKPWKLEEEFKPSIREAIEYYEAKNAEKVQAVDE